MERITEEQMVHLIAYQNLYGPITPDRLDLVAARLGMDVTAPHMKKGARPRLRDHLIQWSRNARAPRSGRELLATVRGIQAAYDRQDARRGRGPRPARDRPA
ncbi:MULTISPECIES: phage tail assembly protein T [Streptomyces]|uniref:phage tail assembly protein T n=1 Tax=Streptomyces TaxID=1883 RepID=UPI00324D3E87